MNSFIANTKQEMRGHLQTAVQRRIELHESQSSAARAWGVPQSTINEIVKGKAKWSTEYLLGLLMRDGLTIKVELT